MAPSTPPSPLLGRILAADASVSGAIHTAAKPFLPPSLLLLLEISADFRFSFPVSLSLLLSPPLRPFLHPFLVGLLLDLLLVGAVKLLVFRRSRPAYNHPSMSAAVSADHSSFPSGHASRVFFVAAAVHFFSSASAAPVSGIGYSFLDDWVRDRDGDVKGEVVAVLWGWACVTAMSRVLLGRHFVLDVAAGACLGILEALFVLRFMRLEEIFGR
ncbi:PREDICTED: probable lipid phosphate phosphatase beta isoform X3 [Tarenaya hassleriana]|uniref:probable lipid phosphate phosphatase beta isoform X3 n=1 Tax=Tarenaya hassleriana TaxID=28532 RepID=UPI00053C2238|nr:PREDICTED: probable lipid phosphate phosphatase beta isoform X3 [Tarenaya hassleriana]